MCCQDCIHHERITARVGHYARVVLWAPCYNIVRPVHPLRNCWHGSIDCLLTGSPTALVIRLAGENHICCILTWKLLPSICWRWGWWWGWISRSSLCQTLNPNALSSGVRCGLAYSTVHLAG